MFTRALDMTVDLKLSHIRRIRIFGDSDMATDASCLSDINSFSELKLWILKG